ncbi:RxLR effector protein [Phytophthora megakarya]|uniref:RxLR effector protein n=1 Tax=Phytophthora megakarya TaxID=4795 RepID=A0A225VZQ0_9STRA|nr:RxLR effector protein [Phytophthora megakarya]
MRRGQAFIALTLALVTSVNGIIAVDKVESIQDENNRNLVSFQDTTPAKDVGSRRSIDLSPSEEERRGVAGGHGRGGGSHTYYPPPAPTKESEKKKCKPVIQEGMSLWEKFKAWWNDPGYC